MVRKRYASIAVIPGDGIGPEVTAEALRILGVVKDVLDLPLRWKKYRAGATLYRNTRKEWSDATKDACLRADATLLGAVGLPGILLDDGRLAGVNVLFGLRKGLWANVRPVSLLPGVDHIISKNAMRIWEPESVDLVVVRENTEGLYDPDKSLWPTGGRAKDTRHITREASERIMRSAFEIAQDRQERGRTSKVTCVAKKNILTGCVLFNEVFTEFAGRYGPAIPTDYLHVDAATHEVLRDPGKYGVLVTSNLFGDILSDLFSLLGGGLGTAPSANLGQGRALFEPVHGSAPDIAGKDIANPLGAIRSASMMLDWLGHEIDDWRLLLAASVVDRAVAETTASGIKTVDVGGTSKCSEVGEAIASTARSISERLCRPGEGEGGVS